MSWLFNSHTDFTDLADFFMSRRNCRNCRNYLKRCLWCCANRSMPGFDAESTWFSLYASIQIKPRPSNISDVTIT